MTVRTLHDKASATPLIRIRESAAPEPDRNAAPRNLRRLAHPQPNLNRRKPDAPRHAGTWKPLPQNRRLVCDLLYFARKVPSQPLVRHCNVATLVELRRQSAPRIGWPALFMKAHGLLAERHPELRQTYMRWPWPHLYEHPVSIARMAVARQYRGQEWVFFAQFLEPERRSLPELQAQIENMKQAPVESIAKFRQQVAFSRFPVPIRRLAWWVSLNGFGPMRTNRFGTFGMTTVSAAGAVSIHPPSLYTTMLTFGPVDESGHVRVTMVYDHRVLAGLEIARYLAELEEILNGPIAEELNASSQIRGGHGNDNDNA